MLNRRQALIGAALLSGGAARADTALRRLADPAHPDAVLGVAAIARGPRGEVRFAEAAGSGLSGEGAAVRTRPFTLDTPVRVASISKLAAAVGFMRLAEAGRLSAEADVSGWLGFRLRHPAHPDVPITPALLASHLSGLRDTETYPVPVGRRLVDALTPGGAQFDPGWWSPAGERPGRFFTYGNVNFAVLAQVMERASGERFDRLMTRTVFAPLGLDCGYNWSGVSQAKRDRASACCRRTGGVWTAEVDAVVPPAPGVRILPAPDQPKITADDYRLGDNGWAFSPQGGLRASVRDLDALAQLLARGGRLGRVRLLRPGSTARMGRPLWRYDAAAANGNTDRGLMRAYGFSVQLLTGRPGKDGDSLFGPDSSGWRGHLGEAYGLLSGLWWNARDGRTLAYVINGTPRDGAVEPGRRSAFSVWEEGVVDAALGGRRG
ncbi:MAG: beta-lactamase family protein [Pseudomonadota bacterium]|nr:beta-lactamase family protein [Pseudomonadota bacterium]